MHRHLRRQLSKQPGEGTPDFFVHSISLVCIDVQLYVLAHWLYDNGSLVCTGLQCRDGSQQRCNKDPASSCSSPRPSHKLLEVPASASLTSFQDPDVDPQQPKKKRGRPSKE